MYNRDRAVEFVLALMYLDVHDDVRAWKGYPWDVLDLMHEYGLIADPKRKAKSIVLTEEGLARAHDAFQTLLAVDKSSVAPTGAPRAASASRLSALQIALVERLLRPVCEPPPDPTVAAQLRHGYRLDGYSVVLFESRPGFRAPHDWQDHDVAKFRFVKVTGEWQLFCQFRDLRWHAYEPLPRSLQQDVLVDEVMRDPTGIFWG
jgi:hypothetical protein